MGNRAPVDLFSFEEDWVGCIDEGGGVWEGGVGGGGHGSPGL